MLIKQANESLTNSFGDFSTHTHTSFRSAHSVQIAFASATDSLRHSLGTLHYVPAVSRGARFKEERKPPAQKRPNPSHPLTGEKITNAKHEPSPPAPKKNLSQFQMICAISGRDDGAREKKQQKNGMLILSIVHRKPNQNPKPEAIGRRWQRVACWGGGVKMFSTRHRDLLFGWLLTDAL